jgi:hypothetical protein
LSQAAAFQDKPGMHRRYGLTDDGWARLAPLLPTMTPGRVAAGGDPQVLTGTVVLGRTGVLGGTCRSALGRGDGL